MNRNKALEWIGTHRVGVSSRTMWCALMGIKGPCDPYAGDFDVPRDADDLSRCVDLVRFAEVTEDELRRIPDAFPCYKPVIDIWGDLVSAYVNRDYHHVYEMLSDARKEARV